jgi:hypothetical protein
MAARFVLTLSANGLIRRFPCSRMEEAVLTLFANEDVQVLPLSYSSKVLSLTSARPAMIAFANATNSP